MTNLISAIANAPAVDISPSQLMWSVYYVTVTLTFDMFTEASFPTGKK